MEEAFTPRKGKAKPLQDTMCQVAMTLNETRPYAYITIWLLPATCNHGNTPVMGAI